MAKLLNQLPLFSLIWFSSYLYKQMVKKVRRKYPGLIKKIKKISAEDIKEAVKGSEVTFVESLSNPEIVTATVIILEVLQTEMFGGFIALNINFPLRGKPGEVEKVTRKILGLDWPIGDAKNRGNGGVVLSVALSDDDTPVRINSRRSKARNGSLQQEFFVAKKEL